MSEEATPHIKIDRDEMAESWLSVEIYKAVFGRLPGHDDLISNEELAERFLKLWEDNPNNYSFSLYLLAQKMLGKYSGSVVRNG